MVKAPGFALPGAFSNCQRTSIGLVAPLECGAGATIAWSLPLSKERFSARFAMHASRRPPSAHKHSGSRDGRTTIVYKLSGEPKTWGQPSGQEPTASKSGGDHA